ncbi:MAG: phosphoenolpyruvate--protein phosphotransferase [Spirochaetales bacterium]|nr:phosphoenolpyruvate--protein phosphotransferase [Spirochaetales bacterium]
MNDKTAQNVTSSRKDIYSSSNLYSDIEREIERAKRYGRKFTLIIVDIDQFKYFNECYGHAAGDTALTGVGESIGSNIRSTDTLYRYGGDEFVILLPETNNTEAKSIAFKVRDILAKKTISDYSINERITLSMGISTFGDHGVETHKKLLQSADKALYKAKKTGKNRIFIYRGKHIEEARQKVLPFEKKRKRMVFTGRPIVKGTTRGILFKYKDFIKREVDIYSINDSDLDNELQRIREAVENVYDDLDRLQNVLDKKIDKKHSDIITAHKLILKDRELLEKIENELKKKRINSEAVIKSIFINLENKFNSFSTPSFKSKGKDFADVGNKLLRKLMHINTHHLKHVPKNSIIFAERILPTDIIHIDRTKLNGIISIEGSEYSHAGILARAFNIPYVTHINASYGDLSDKSEIILNGDTGKIIVNPNENDRNKFLEKSKSVKIENIEKKYKGDLLLRKDNELIKIKANIETKEDIELVAKYRPAAIGLTRLEYIYLMHSQKPTRDELYDRLYSMFEPVKSIPITIRLLDIGGDKSLPYINSGKTDHRKMGIMGVRFLLEHPDLLEDQIEACFLLSEHFTVNVLVPMVTIPDDVGRVRDIKDRIMKNKKKIFRYDFKLGAMIEVPSAVFLLDKILDCIDFVSIGTNDLIQYIMAADREENKVSGYFRKGNDIAIDIIKRIVDKTRETGIECDVCGELAGNTAYTKRLLKAGLRNFSVQPRTIPKLRKKIDDII